MIELTDCWISPSNEDDVTFTVHIVSGETFKFRGDFQADDEYRFTSLFQRTMPKTDRNGSINYELLPDRMLLIWSASVTRPLLHSVSFFFKVCLLSSLVEIYFDGLFVLSLPITWSTNTYVQSTRLKVGSSQDSSHHQESSDVLESIIINKPWKRWKKFFTVSSWTNGISSKRSM